MVLAQSLGAMNRKSRLIVIVLSKHFTTIVQRNGEILYIHHLLLELPGDLVGDSESGSDILGLVTSRGLGCNGLMFCGDPFVGDKRCGTEFPRLRRGLAFPGGDFVGVTGGCDMLLSNTFIISDSVLEFRLTDDRFESFLGDESF